MPLPVQNGQATFTIPSGTPKYSVAYSCVNFLPEANLTITDEFVIQATTQDADALVGDCSGAIVFGSAPAITSGIATGSVDATGVPGTSLVTIVGNRGIATFVNSAQGSFSFSLPSGTNDILVIAVGQNFQPLAVKIIRGQTVPGAINGGATITLGPDDQTTSQSLTINNVPAGFVTSPNARVDFYTASGAAYELDNQSATQYQAVATSAVQSGDLYVYEAVACSPTLAQESLVGMMQTTSSGGGPASITLPDPWSSSKPTTTSSPITFTFDYPGFSGMPVIAEEAKVEWMSSSSRSSITVTATANFQSGANTVSIPNLAALGFPYFASGTSIHWLAFVFGSTAPTSPFAYQSLTFPFLNAPSHRPPVNASIAFVRNGGFFTAP